MQELVWILLGIIVLGTVGLSLLQEIIDNWMKNKHE